MGGLTPSTPQFLVGVAGKEQCDFFRGFQFLHKNNELKSEIFNDKTKFINKNTFVCHSLEFKLANFN